MTKTKTFAGGFEAAPAPVRLDAAEWARRKRTPAWLLAAAIRHADWPLTATETGFARLVTEADFDAAVRAAFSIHLR